MPNPNQPPKPETLETPSDQRKFAPSKKPFAKIDWRASRWHSFRWFAVLVLVSVGLHAIAFLIPISEEQTVIEKEEVLPEPIQVSSLPLSELPEEEPAEPLAEPQPAPPAPPPPPPEPAPVPQQPVAAPLPATLPPELLQEPLVEPIVEPPVELPPDDPPPKDPDPKPPDQPVTRQSYDATGTTQEEAFSELGSFFNSGGLGDFYNFNFADMQPVSAGGGSAPLLSLSYPAEENSCFEDISNPSLEAGLAAIVGDLEENGSNKRAVIEAQVLQKTGYEAVDTWLEDVVTGSEDAGIDVYDAIATSASNAMLPVNSPDELFSFKVIVELPDQPCD